MGDYVDTVKEAYRLDFWASLPRYVHVFVEKDAVAGTLAPVTREYDVALSPIRGYVSVSFAHEIGEEWAEIKKPIFAYYLGDFDASGFDLTSKTGKYVLTVSVSPLGQASVCTKKGDILGYPTC